MNHTQINNHNYPTIESLANSAGCFNTALSKSKHLCELNAYKQLLEQTRELDVFDGIQPKHRFSYYMGDSKIEHCVKCGKPFIYFQKSEHRFSLCQHKQIQDIDKHSQNLKQCKHKKKENFIKALDQKQLMLSEEDYHNNLAALFAKPDNYAFIVTNDKYSGFYHDLIIRTENIISVDIDDLQISRRMYLEYNCLSAEPLCRYCGKNKVIFINRKRGYNDSCNECSLIKSNNTREINNRQDIDKVFNFQKYDIISYPKLLNKDPLVIRCHKCGKMSEIFVRNGFMPSLHDAPLCSGCERRSDWEETEFFNFIKSIYKGEIVHREGCRKIIAPYELDVYLPDIHVAFEYDGLYWHNDQIKKEHDYHLMKTNMCSEKDIHLVHVFSSDWNMHRDVVKSRIKDLLGIYDNTVYARNCIVKNITSGMSQNFQNLNSIDEYVSSSVQIGLYYENDLLAIMTLRKCRSYKKYEWEMLCFCIKGGYHIPGAASKLLKYFEYNYRPKSIVAYADRRWGYGNFYFSLGFQFERNTRPDYWYFKNRTDILLPRINFQKCQLSRKLDVFDSTKTESENMRMNDYLRIFDCGNAVFVKRFDGGK